MNADGVSVCLIVRDGAADLRAALSAVHERRHSLSDVVLVDDASSDDSVDVALETLPELRVVRLPQSLGPGGARNAGLRTTRERWVLFVDSDVALDVGCPEALIAAACAHSATFAVPAVVRATQPDQVQFDGAAAHFLGLMTLTNSGVPLQELPLAAREIGSFATPCFLLDRSRWPEADLFDESFLFNLEDHDLGLRARIRGLRMVSVPAARVRHGGGTPGFSVRGEAPPPPVRTYCLIRNRWRIMLTCYQAKTIILLAPMLAVYEVFQLLGVVHRGWLRQWLQAAGWMLRHVRELLTRRRYIQRTRSVSDALILEGGPLPFRAELVRSPLERLALRLLQRMADGWWVLTRRFLG